MLYWRSSLATHFHLWFHFTLLPPWLEMEHSPVKEPPPLCKLAERKRCNFVGTEGLINEVNMSIYCAPTVSAAVRSVVQWSKDAIKLVKQNRASDLTAVSVIAGLRPHQSHVAICILSDRPWRPHRQRKGICEHIPGLAGKY